MTFGSYICEPSPPALRPESKASVSVEKTMSGRCSPRKQLQRAVAAAAAVVRRGSQRHPNSDHQLPKSDHHHLASHKDTNRSEHSADWLTDLGNNSSLRYSPVTSGSLSIDQGPLLSRMFMFSFIIQLFATTLAITTPAMPWRHNRVGEDDQMRLAWAPASDATGPSRLIPSARYVYTTSTSANMQRNGQQAKREKILALHSQLNQLKRELDAELGGSQQQQTATTSGNSNRHGSDPGMAALDQTDARHAPPLPQVALGSPCLSSSFCNKSIRNSQCNLETFTCACQSQHVKFNSTTCLAPALLGYECQLDSQCQQRVPESVCQAGKCACPTESFVSYRKNKCLAASKLDDYCLLDSQCQLNDKHSFCKWKIQNIYGTCKCPPNYKLLSDYQNNLRCAPRLGDSCLSDRECQLATANSECRAPPGQDMSRAKSTRQGYNKWPTSSASNSRCHCSTGFEASHNQLDCVRDPTFASLSSSALSSKTNASRPSEAPSDALEAHQQDSHKYEMIVISMQERANKSSSAPPAITTSTTHGQQQQQEELEIKLMPMESEVRRKSSPVSSTTTTTTTSTTTEGPRVTQAERTQMVVPAANVSLQQTSLRMSSLGKPCRWRQECQARDPFSDCIGGVCECIAPSARCRASQTGCHPDTFQCRNGQCISWYFVCDQFKNCDDGSDEDECLARHCPRESFQCHQDGACLTKGKVCNGKRDCLDGSDEFDCEPAAALPAVAAAAVAVAADNNGPLVVAAANHSCPTDAFTCSSGQCLPGYVFCNAAEDCADGSDEDELVCERKRPPPQSANASLVTNNPTARNSSSAATSSLQLGENSSVSQQQQQQQQESPLVKTDRASIERLMASLAMGKWTPESRGRIKAPSAESTGARRSKLLARRPTDAFRGELAAPFAGASARSNQRLTGKRETLVNVEPNECPRWAFTCRNGKCRSSAIICSGVDGCGDNSDEDRCEVCQCEAPPPPPPPATRPSGGTLARTANSRRRNGWVAAPA